MLVVVVETGLGNVRSVEKAVETAAQELGLRNVSVERTADPDRVRRADRLIVPGQGAFRDAARALDAGLGELLNERLRAGTPYLGICLGLQILFESSDECPGAAGLGYFKGHVRRLQGGAGIKIPHMGWNQLEARGALPPALERAGGAGTWFYFVHSYHAVPEDGALVSATVDYGSNVVTAAITRDNVLATQFHPEKSQAAGLRLLAGFMSQGPT